MQKGKLPDQLRHCARFARELQLGPLLFAPTGPDHAGSGRELEMSSSELIRQGSAQPADDRWRRRAVRDSSATSSLDSKLPPRTPRVRVPCVSIGVRGPIPFTAPEVLFP